MFNWAQLLFRTRKGLLYSWGQEYLEFPDSLAKWMVDYVLRKYDGDLSAAQFYKNLTNVLSYGRKVHAHQMRVSIAKQIICSV